MARERKLAKELSSEEKLEQALVPIDEQPYKIPNKWAWIKFSNIANIRTGKKDANYGSACGKYFFFTCASEPIRCTDYSFDCKAILLAGNGNISNISMYNGKFEAYQRTYVVEITVPLLTEYFYYYFQYRWVDYNTDKMFGTAIPYIRLKNLQKFPIPLSPLSEQQRIVDRIESLFAKLDEAREKAQAVVDGFELRKSAILHKAFMGDLTAQWRKEHGVGLESWEDDLLGKNLYPEESKKPQGETFRYIDIDSIDNKSQVVRSPKVIMVKNAPSRASRGLCKNDIVFSMVRPYLKNIAFIDEHLSDCIASTGFYVCRCKDRVVPQFLFKFLCSDDAINYLMQYMKGDNSPSIRKNHLLNMPIKIPTRIEQTEIVSILDNLFVKEQQAKETAEAVLDQIDTMKKVILARAFRGELGTNDPADSWAGELLEKVL